MKRGKNTGDEGALNPAFDPRARRIGFPNSRSLQLRRGKLIHDGVPVDLGGMGNPARDNSEAGSANPNGNPVNPGSGKFVNFMYNPISVGVSHAGNPYVQNGMYRTPDDVTALLPMTGFGSLSTTLLFDRTFELWDRSKGGLAEKNGVYADVVAFYYLLGIVPGMVDLNLRALPPSSYIKPDIFMIEFGDLLRYRGRITGFSVEYTHFNVDMTPTRAAISLDMELMNGAPGTASGESPTEESTSNPNPSVRIGNRPSVGGLLGR